MTVISLPDPSTSRTSGLKPWRAGSEKAAGLEIELDHNQLAVLQTAEYEPTSPRSQLSGRSPRRVHRDDWFPVTLSPERADCENGRIAAAEPVDAGMPVGLLAEECDARSSERTPGDEQNERASALSHQLRHFLLI